MPDLIALSKLEVFDRQHEQRLLFFRTDALDFGDVSATIVRGEAENDTEQHTNEDIAVGYFSDIATLHVF